MPEAQGLPLKSLVDLARECLAEHLPPLAVARRVRAEGGTEDDLAITTAMVTHLEENASWKPVCDVCGADLTKDWYAVYIGRCRGCYR